MMFLAKIISFLANPLFVLFPVPFLLIYRTSNDSLYAFKWTVFSIFFMLLIGIFMLYEVRRGSFTDLDVSKKEQRPLLFVFIGVIAFFYLISLILLKGPPILFITIWGIMVGVILVSLINTRVKASIHVATITAVIITIGYLYNAPLSMYFLIPVIAWARVTAKRHTLAETIVGGGVGIILTLFMYIIVKYILDIHV